jgi:hypothetical protein
MTSCSSRTRSGLRDRNKPVASWRFVPVPAWNPNCPPGVKSFEELPAAPGNGRPRGAARRTVQPNNDYRRFFFFFLPPLASASGAGAAACMS